MDEDDLGNLTDEEEVVMIEQVKIIEVPENIVVGAPRNKNNSCFLDSLLMALFFIDNLFIDYCFLNKVLHTETVKTKMIFGLDAENDLQKRKDVQMLLKTFVESIRQKTMNSTDESVQNLRICLAECKFECLKNTTQQQDAMEYLYALLEILQLNENFNELKTNVFGTNDLLNMNPDPIVCTTTRIEKTSPVYHIVTCTENDSLSHLLKTKLDSGILKDEFRDSMTGKTFQRQITTIQYVPLHSFFICHIDRTLLQKKQVSIKLEECIYVNKKQFEICSIVMHQGSSITYGHYVCLLKTKDRKWMLYDDTKLAMQHFDTFTQAMLKTKACEQCVFILFVQ